MSKASPISVRIASRTRCFETAGDSSYYYSSQLLTNISFLKSLSQLGQQLGWVTKSNEAQSLQKQANSDLSRINLDLKSLPKKSVEYSISLKGGPGKKWTSANNCLVKRLSTSQQFFNSKAIGFLSKSMVGLQSFNSHYLFSKGASPEKKPVWTDCFSTLAQLARFSPARVYKKARSEDYILNKATLQRKVELLKRVESLQPIYSGYFQRSLVNVRNAYEERYPENKTNPKKTINFSFLNQNNDQSGFLRRLRRDSKLVFKTPTGLPLFLSTLALASHHQVLRNSLAIVPIVAGSLQSDLLLSNHKEVVKASSSSGIGQVSSNPGVYITRSIKNTVLSLFLRIPSPLMASLDKYSSVSETDEKLNWRRSRKTPLNHIFIIGDLGIEKKRKSARFRGTYSSIRWS